MNFELGTHGANFSFDEESWSASVLSLATKSTKIFLFHGEREVLAPSFGRASAFFTSWFTSPHAGQLEKGDPVDQGHCQWGASSEKEP